MSDIVIKVENLSKQYRLGNVGTGSLAHDLNRTWYRIRGKEDPYLKIGETNDRTKKGSIDYVWALQDINFEVKQGEVLGIIGRNGAGKSTLLKILSRTTTPTTGSVKIKGRIASLLEVGTGFHPELSGRENIFLNGAILGMTKQEIKRRFDEIVDFAGVERYIDTPVKRYSSGMYVRLAFGVAAHLEPEILIVDEVLAVGDAEFQKKALGKMKDVSTKDGRTVLFVSHNIGAINTLCNQGIVLSEGIQVFTGTTNDAIQYYSTNSEAKEVTGAIHMVLDGKAIIKNYTFYSENIQLGDGSRLLMGKSIMIQMEVGSNEMIKDLSIAIDIRNQQDELISHLINDDGKYFISSFLPNQQKKIVIETEKIFFTPGLYTIDLWIGASHNGGCYRIKNAIKIYIEQSDVVGRTRKLPNQMKYYLNSVWKDGQ